MENRNEINLNELNKLEEYLKSKNFNYERIDKEAEPGMGPYCRHQLIIYSDSYREWDAICHYGSYGFEDGLLEIYGTIVPEDADDGVIGWLTADDVIKLLEKENN